MSRARLIGRLAAKFGIGFVCGLPLLLVASVAMGVFAAMNGLPVPQADVSELQASLSSVLGGER